jgi:hypothetical protein
LRGWKRSALIYVAVLFLYALLTVVMTWPVTARLSTHLVGDGDDMWVHYWNNWWIKRVLRQGGTVYHTDLLFHPTGVSLLYHNFGWVNAALWLALESIVGGIAAYNLAYLIHIPLCGLAMFGLARHLTKSHAVALIAGLIYAFWPYRMLDANHPNMISTEGFPLLMLALLHLIQGHRPFWSGVIGGVLLALIGYMRWQLVILAGFMAGLYLLYTLIWQPQRWNWRTVAGLAMLALVASVLVAPAVYPIVEEQLEHGLPQDITLVESGSYKQDLLAWVLPQHQHILSPLYNRVFPDYGLSRERHRFSAFPGHIASVLAAIGVASQRGRKDTWFWLGFASLCLVFAWGPTLRFNTVLYAGIPLPYRLIGWLLPVKLLRNPHRFTALLAVPVAVLAGYGTLALKTWLARHRQEHRMALSMAWPLLLGALVLLDCWSVPTVTVSADVPTFYRDLAEKQGDFAVTGLPGTRGHTEYYMFYQTAHERPILGGHVSRLPPEALAFASSVPLVAGVYEEAPGRTCPPDLSRQLSMLADAGFRYIVLHKEIASERKLDPWRSCLVMSPRYEDEEVGVYTTTPVAGRDFSLQHHLGDGMGLIEVTLHQERVHPDAVLDLDVIWGTEECPQRELQVEIALMDGDGVGQSEQFEISPVWPTGEWPANAIVRNTYSFQVDPWLSGGMQTVGVRLVQEGDERPLGAEERGRPHGYANVGQVLMEAPERSFAVPTMEHVVRADFGDVLRLLGYDLTVARDALRVMLHWQAVQRMDESYKILLHLLAVGGEEIAAQKDVIPRDWAYPTSWWEAEEVVSDEIVLPLKDVPPGRYRLWVGVYEPLTGERLSISAADPEYDVVQGRLMLPERIAR